MLMRHSTTFLLALIIGMATAAAKGPEVNIGGMIFKELDSTGEAKLLSGRDMKGDVVIPDEVTIEGVRMPVTLISQYAFLANRDITSVVLSKNTEGIGNQAFDGCENLKSVKLNEGLSFISNHAFDGTAIKELTLPKSYVNMNCDAIPAGTKIRQTSPVKIFRDFDGSKYYSPAEKRNLTGSPTIIMTHWVGCKPCSAAARDVYNYLFKNNRSDIKLVILNPIYQKRAYKPWFEEMARRADYNVEKAINAPLMYFVNTDGTLAAPTILGYDLYDSSKNDPIWQSISKLR